MDSVLNKLQRLICHKTQTNKQTNKQIKPSEQTGKKLKTLNERGHFGRS